MNLHLLLTPLFLCSDGSDQEFFSKVEVELALENFLERKLTAACSGLYCYLYHLLTPSITWRRKERDTKRFVTLYFYEVSKEFLLLTFSKRRLKKKCLIRSLSKSEV